MSREIKLLLLLSVFYQALAAQIAARYPFDSLIHTDPAVIFAEQFEQTSVATMISASGYKFLGSTTNLNFDPSVPPGSHGKQSLRFTTIPGSNLNELTQLNKRFASGIADSIFVRYYIKYNQTHTFHHSGLWLGGTNPAYSCFPCVFPGSKPSGDSAFQVGAEVRNAMISPQSTGKIGFYNYWTKMHQYTSGPNAGKYYGNEFIHPNGSIDMAQWNCIEVRLVLNSPVADKNGALTLWINGKKIAAYGPGFPNGTWAEAFFNEGPGAPFEGFQWRDADALKFTYFWLQNYATNNAAYPSPNDIYFDHIVVAKKYIGPLKTIVTSLSPFQEEEKIQIFPNPGDQEVFLSKPANGFTLLSLSGQIIARSTAKTNKVEVGKVPTGLYLLVINGQRKKLLILH